MLPSPKRAELNSSSTLAQISVKKAVAANKLRTDLETILLRGEQVALRSVSHQSRPCAQTRIVPTSRVKTSTMPIKTPPHRSAATTNEIRAIRPQAGQAGPARKIICFQERVAPSATSSSLTCSARRRTPSICSTCRCRGSLTTATSLSSTSLAKELCPPTVRPIWPLVTLFPRLTAKKASVG